MRPHRTVAAFVVALAVAASAWAQPPAGQKPQAPKPSAAQAKAGAASAKTLGTPADEKAIRALADQYAGGYNAGDAAKATSIFAENAVFVDPSGKAWEGRDQIEKQLAGDGQGTRPRLTLTTHAVRFIKPDVALSRGTSNYEGGNIPPGQGAGHWAAVSMKLGGQWKVVAVDTAANPPERGPAK